MNLVIVESPAKAKTINKYLGSDYKVVASFGHIRDLPPKDGSVDPDQDFKMIWEVDGRSEKHVKEIMKEVKGAERVFLATDPDREGEAISWHLAEILNEKKLLKPGKLKRVAFYEITESAVKDAVAHPREVSMDLVNAQQARRVLDYLVGFNLSPLLWKKISPGLSAGRVQSPALRLIVEREAEIEKFKPREYWTLHLDSHKDKQSFSARLTHFEGEKLTQFSVENEARQAQMLKMLESREARVMQVEKKRKARHAPPPFTTSTLQQAAVRQLGMTTDRVMRTAQQLYEGIDIGSGTVGLITYMRTDSVNLAKEAVADIRAFVGKKFDQDYLPSQPIHYRAKTKNAQEAHEAIRPTGVARTPESLKNFLSHDQSRLYELVWKRAVASQMTAAQFDTVAADLMVGQGVFRATGQTLAFAGFLAVYHDDEEDEEETRLPPLKEGETLPVDKLYGEQHFTQPPPRYTEASLVKALEEYGIGRPSTYASIISTLQDREYVVLDKKRFVPTDMGRIVNGFLTLHFTHYVDYDFTARLEDKLDDVSNGKREWTKLLADFWQEFDGTLAAKQDVERGIPLDEKCPKCGAVLNLQASKRGLFIGCSAYPKCDYTRPLHGNEGGPTVLGKYPATGEDVLLMNGRYGWYVQVGTTPEDKKAPKPRRASLPKGMAPESATLEDALKWLSLPREVGHNPKTGLPIVANIGRFGPYLLHDGKFKSIPKDDDVYAIGLARAVEVLEMPAARGRGADAGEKKALGKHPDDDKPVFLQNGRYGWYVSHNKVNATLPKDIDPQSVTLLDALPLIAARAEKGAAGKGGATKRAPAKKAPARKAAKP